MVLDPTLDNNKTNYSSTNLPDYIVLEQSYLDNYTMAYNTNRVASSKYTYSEASINVGKDNPSYNLLGENSFVWNRTHSDELRSLWSTARSKYTLFMYSSTTFYLIQKFPSAVKLAAYFPESGKSFGYGVIKLILKSDYPAIRYSEYIISMVPLDSAFLRINFDLFTIKKVKNLLSQRKGKIIYGFNPSTNEYRTWFSKERCTFDLTNRRYENHKTVNKRIDKNLLYYGFYLQTKPFNSNSK